MIGVEQVIRPIGMGHEFISQHVSLSLDDTIRFLRIRHSDRGKDYEINLTSTYYIFLTKNQSRIIFVRKRIMFATIYKIYIRLSLNSIFINSKRLIEYTIQ